MMPGFRSHDSRRRESYLSPLVRSALPGVGFFSLTEACLPIGADKGMKTARYVWDRDTHSPERASNAEGQVRSIGETLVFRMFRSHSWGGVGLFNLP